MKVSINISVAGLVLSVIISVHVLGEVPELLSGARKLVILRKVYCWGWFWLLVRKMSLIIPVLS
jgi:hypothetical protein